jgi:hypothetical protein
MKQKILLSTLLGATTSLMALGAEQAFLYKDPRIMGMGGANVAVGSYSTSVFSNPAGLATLKKDDGFIVDLLGLSVSATGDIADFADDIGNADTDDEMTAVLEKYAGQHFHIGVDNYSAISKNSDAFAWSVGLLAASDVNLQAHPNSGPDGVLASSSRGYAGLVVGAAKPFTTKYGRVDVGVSVKYITQQSYEGSLLVSDLTDDDNDIGETLQDKYEKTSSGIGVDLGVTYHPFENNYWHPAIGMSILNIGSMDMDDNYGGQPMTLNFGASITPEVPYLDKLVVAVDYVDALNSNVIRDYTYSDSGDVTYEDFDDTDVMKRLRLGVGLGLIDNSYFGTTVNVGMYQGAYTAGLDMRLTLIKLNIATYEEEVGTGSVEIPDRRYMVQLGMGW